MSLFGNKKKSIAFSDILGGLQQAISSAQSILQESHKDNIQRLFDTNGSPQTKSIKVGERTMEIPLMALVPHNQLSMEEVEIKFKTRVGDISTNSTPNLMGSKDGALPFANLQMEMDGISADAKDVMEVTIRFKSKDMPEAMARVIDEYNKLI